MIGDQTLAELDFSDLLIGASGTFLKNLFGAPKALTQINEAGDNALSTDLIGIKGALERSEHEPPEFSLKYDQIMYRVSKAQTVDGLLYVMRKGKPTVPEINELGLPSFLIDKLLSSHRKDGLILISGQMSSGKTTTAAAFVKSWLDRYGGHAVTLEDPPEYPLQEQCTQNGRCYQFDITGKDMGQELAKTLRRAANLIFLGELRKAGAISEALEASINGHLIVATIHSSSPKAALQKIITLGSKIDGDSTCATLATGFAAVVHQDLDPKTKRVSVKFLFAEDGFDEQANAIRATIRDNTIHKLEDFISRQRNMMKLAMKRTRN